MRKFKFIGTDEDINLYTQKIADYLVIGKIYSEEDLEGLYLDCWQSPEKNLIKSDWEEVIDEQKSPEQYYAGENQINTVSISGVYNGVVFSLAGDFEQCVKLFNFIGYLDSKK